MYDDPHGVRITVFVLPLNSAASAPIQHVDFAHVDGCAWIDKSIGYTVVGNLPPTELRRIAELVRSQLG
jgi:anti-sigma factor RsiW